MHTSDASAREHARTAGFGWRSPSGLRAAVARSGQALDDAGSLFEDEAGSSTVFGAYGGMAARLRQSSLALQYDLHRFGAVDLRVDRVARESQDPAYAGLGLRERFGPVPGTDYLFNAVSADWRGQLRQFNVQMQAGTWSERGRVENGSIQGAWAPVTLTTGRAAHHLAAGASTALGPLSLQLGVRYEQAMGFDPISQRTTSVQYRLEGQGGRVGLMLRSTDSLPGWSAPNSTLGANGAFGTQRGRHAELFYASADSAPWQARFALFRANYRDLLDGQRQLFGRSARLANGVEWRLARQLSGPFGAYVQGSVVAAHDWDGVGGASYLVREQASIGLDAQWLPGWRAQVGINLVGRRVDSPYSANARWLAGYGEATLALAWRQAAWRMVFALDNLTNRQSEPVFGEPVSERRLRFSLQWGR